MSRIREALADKTLLLTGVTGFFAKALLAKLLADVPEVRRIYVLIRPGASSRDPAASVQGETQKGEPQEMVGGESGLFQGSVQ